MSEDASKIRNFFKNQTIFVTGATGLVGLILVEKLLRSCWTLNKIYLLIRPKNGKSAQERFKELFDDPCFDLVKSKNLSEKVFLINGDCNQPDLGLSFQDRETLRTETTCVIHVAANVKFDQTLKEASFHLKSTQDLVDLAKEMTNLKTFVYISSIYTKCTSPVIKEQFWDPPVKAETLLQLVSSVDDTALEKMAPSLLGDEFPNTYLYIKNITEDFLRSCGLTVPIAIVRPGNISNTVEEPLKGWVNNDFGLMGVLTGVNMGVVRSFRFEEDCAVCLIPVDYLTNFILAVTWKTAQDTSSTAKIYHCIGRPTKIGEAYEFSRQCYVEFASEKYQWYHTNVRCYHLLTHKFWTICSILLGYFIDFINQGLGRRSSYGKRLQCLSVKLDHLSYFALRNWEYEETNFWNLWTEMGEDDKKIFKFNSDSMDVKEYLHNSFQGLRIYLLKDPLHTISKGRSHVKKLFFLHVIAIIVFWVCLGLLVFTLFKLFI